MTASDILLLQHEFLKNEANHEHYKNYILLADNFGDFNQRHLAILHKINVESGKVDRKIQIKVFVEVYSPLVDKLFG